MSRLVNAAAAVGFLFAGSRSVVSGQPPAPLVTVCVYTKSAEFMDEAQKSRQAAVAALTQLLTSGFHVPPATANGIRLVEHASDANVTVEIGAVGLVPNFYRRPKDDFMWPPALRQVRAVLHVGTYSTPIDGVEYFQTPELAITIIHAEEKIAENIYQWIKDNRAKLIGNLSRKRRVRELGRRMDWRRQIPREQMTALRKAMRLSLDAVIASSMR